MNITKNPFIKLGYLIICLIMSIGLIKSIVGHFQRTDMVGERKSALLKEQARNQELKNKLKEATSGAFIEKQAREKLGMAKEGETIVLIDKAGVVNQPTGEMRQDEQVSHWRRWWRLFF